MPNITSTARPNAGTYLTLGAAFSAVVKAQANGLSKNGSFRNVTHTSNKVERHFQAVSNYTTHNQSSVPIKDRHSKGHHCCNHNYGRQNSSHRSHVRIRQHSEKPNYYSSSNRSSGFNNSSDSNKHSLTVAAKSNRVNQLDHLSNKVDGRLQTTEAVPLDRKKKSTPPLNTDMARAAASKSNGNLQASIFTVDEKKFIHSDACEDNTLHSSKMENGWKPGNGKFPAVAELKDWYDTACTSTHIGSGILATAAHCLWYDDTGYSPMHVFEIDFKNPPPNKKI